MSCKCGRGSCAGSCAGNASKFSKPTKPFRRVKDRRGSPIRGLWKRGTKYYGRIVIKEPGNPGVDKRVGLDAGTVPEAKAELQRLRIKWCDADWPMDQLMIGADGLAKNHEFRVVDFNPALERHLRSMRGRRGDSAYLFSAPGKHDHDVPVRCLKEALDRARNAAGTPDFTFRDCRNHFISQGVIGGIDFMTTAKWGGHKDGRHSGWEGLRPLER